MSRVRDLKDKYILEVEVPGYSSADVNVEVKYYQEDILGFGVFQEARKLVISAENESRGKISGEFLIEFNLIDFDSIEANVKDGLLTIQLPLKKKYLAKNIPVS